MLQDKRKRWWEQLLLGNMYGGQSLPADATMEQQQDYLRKQAMGASGSALLGASGWSPVPITTGQALADAFGAGRQAYTQGSQDLIAQRKAMAEQQAAAQQKAQFEQWLQSLPPEMAQVYRLMGPQAAAKAQTDQQTAKIRAGGGKKFMNVPAGGSIFDPETGKVVFQNERTAPFDVVTLQRPDGSAVQVQRDPITGSMYDMAGNQVGGGLRNTSRSAPNPAPDVIAQIEQEQGAPLKPEAKKRLTGALQMGQPFDVGESDFLPLGVSQSSAEKASAKEGAKVDAERVKNQPAAYARMLSGLELAERVRANVVRAKEQTDYSSAGLFGQLTHNIGGTPAKSLESRIDTVKANLGFAELQKMRENSPTGGALGGIAVQELKMLQSTIESLDQSQDPKELSAALDRVDAHLARWADAIKRDYEMRYGSGAHSTQAPIQAASGWSIEPIED